VRAFIWSAKHRANSEQNLLSALEGR